MSSRPRAVNAFRASCVTPGIAPSMTAAQKSMSENASTFPVASAPSSQHARTRGSARSRSRRIPISWSRSGSICCTTTCTGCRLTGPYTSLEDATKRWQVEPMLTLTHRRVRAPITGRSRNRATPASDALGLVSGRTSGDRGPSYEQEIARRCADGADSLGPRLDRGGPWPRRGGKATVKLD
jgi:hypothetical protein